MNGFMAEMTRQPSVFVVMMEMYLLRVDAHGTAQSVVHGVRAGLGRWAGRATTVVFRFIK